MGLRLGVKRKQLSQGKEGCGSLQQAVRGVGPAGAEGKRNRHRKPEWELRGMVSVLFFAPFPGHLQCLTTQ